MSNIKNLLARANAPIRAKESSVTSETNALDELQDTTQDIAINSMPFTMNSGCNSTLTKDGQQLQPGDPVTGIHRGQNMSGQVLSVKDDTAVVEWKDREITRVKIASLTMTNVDDDYEEQTMYIESKDPVPNMGFDKESFVEDTDLESLLKGGANGSLDSGVSFKYGDLNDF